MALVTTLKVSVSVSLDIKDSFVLILVQKERLEEDVWESALVSMVDNATMSMESAGQVSFKKFNVNKLRVCSVNLFNA